MERLEPPKSDIIQRLSGELQLDICEFLSYQDAIMLSQVNRYFHRLIQPWKWPNERKTEFLMQAQLFKKYNIYEALRTTSGNTLYRSIVNCLACFLCYQIKPIHAFAAPQALHNGMLTIHTKGIRTYRQCIECKVARKMYGHGDQYRVILQMSILHDPDDDYLDFCVLKDVCRRFCEKCQRMHSLASWPRGEGSCYYQGGARG